MSILDIWRRRPGYAAVATLITNLSLFQQIDDTVGVMRENINKVSQRGERLDSLQDKTDNLAVSAQGFRRGANRVRKQMWWKDMKMRVCLAICVVVLLIVIIVPGKTLLHGKRRQIAVGKRREERDWISSESTTLTRSSE